MYYKLILVIVCMASYLASANLLGRGASTFLVQEKRRPLSFRLGSEAAVSTQPYESRPKSDVIMEVSFLLFTLAPCYRLLDICTRDTIRDAQLIPETHRDGIQMIQGKLFDCGCKD